MMQLNIKVKMNSTNKIIKEHGLDKDGRVVRFLRDTADRFMNPFIPMDNGEWKEIHHQIANLF